MQQSLHLLSLSNEELLETIQEESLENPILELEQPSNFQTYRSIESLTLSKQMSFIERKDFFAQDHLPEPENLKTFLLKQKNQSFYSKEMKNLIEVLISYLDERAYLRVNIQELAFKNKTTSVKILEALKILQSFEPWGAGARSLEECLLIQMRQKKIKEPHLKELILNHLELLKDKKYPYIARELKLDLKEVKRLVEILKSLQPNPAFNFSSEPTVFVRPDIYIYKQDDSFHILFNKDSLPSLRVSSFYADCLSQKNILSLKERKYLKNKKKAADFLIQALYQREERIKKTTSFIIKHQEDFFHKGFPFLKPLKMTDLAEELNIHVSTVSRTVSNKYAHTPHGMMALRDFFIKATRSSFINSPSIKKIKESIKKWIEEEDSQKPLSDEDLRVRVEKTFKVNLTRRRMSQYRLSLNIPKSRIRKLNFLYSS